MRVAYVTSGEVGGGHLARGVAIGRAIDRARAPIELRLFARALPFPSVAEPRLRAVAIDPVALGDPDLAPASELGRALLAFDPDVVLVDFFWMTVRHLLPRLRAEAWLLLRWSPPGWTVSPFHRKFDASQYRRVIAIEPLARGDDRVEPIVMANRDELLPPGALAAHLGAKEAASIVLVVQTGAPGEVDELFARARRSAAADDLVVPMSLWNEGALFPIAPWLAGTRRIVGGAGYNLVWETRWLGLHDRAELVPFRRTIDDQAARERSCREHVMRKNGADQLVAELLGR